MGIPIPGITLAPGAMAVAIITGVAMVVITTAEGSIQVVSSLGTRPESTIPSSTNFLANLLIRVAPREPDVQQLNQDELR
jgi:hypothetical protein